MSNPHIRSKKAMPYPAASAKRPRKGIVTVKAEEVYTAADIKEIKEGFEQIKRGECVSHDELKRLLDL